VALAAAPAATQAQLIRVPMSDQRRLPVSVTASAGYFFTQDRFDGISGLTWFLGDAWQYRLGADVGLRAGSIGVAGTVASVPIQRGASLASNGTIQLRQLLATFRSPEPQSFGQVIELGVGVSQWTDYSGTDVLTDEDAATRNAFAIALTYGFSMPLGKRFAAQLAQDYTTAIGSREGLPAGARRSQEQYTTRIGLRWKATGVRE
jgi:hypothetical protein